MAVASGDGRKRRDGVEDKFEERKSKSRNEGADGESPKRFV